MFSPLLTQISKTAALGYVWLLFLNPLNSTRDRQAEPQQVFTMKSMKGICLSQSTPPVNGQKTLLCAEMRPWVGAAMGGCAWNEIGGMQLIQMFWREFYLSLSMPLQRKKKFRHVIWTKLHFKNLHHRGQLRSSFQSLDIQDRHKTPIAVC